MKNRFNEMRYLLFVLLLILPVFAGAQTRVYVTQDQPQQIRQFRGGVDALNCFRLPVQGGHSIPAGDSLWFVRVNPGDGNVYMWDGLTWKCVSCGSGSGADSSVFATNYRLDTTRLGLEQGLNDTAAVLRDSIASLRGDIPDISGLVPQSRTITINGIAQDLSANRSWTIPVPDTSSLRADIDANSDSILAHRTAINGKEPVISAGTTSQYWRGDKTWQAFPFIPDSSDYWTRHDADTSLQNIRDEIDNLPAPPVTSVNGQTGNVVLQFMDTAYVSGDTIYAEKGGNTFVVGVIAVSAIIADSLSGVIRQGGNSFGVPVEIGSNDNFPLNFRVNNATRFRATNWFTNYGLLHPSQNTGIVFANNSLHFPSTGDFIFYPGGSGSTNVMRYTTSGLAIGYGDGTNASAKLDVNGSALINGGTLEVKGNSATVGLVASFQNLSGIEILKVLNGRAVDFEGTIRIQTNNGRALFGTNGNTIYQLETRSSNSAVTPMMISNSAVNGYSEALFGNNTQTPQGKIGYANTSATAMADTFYVGSITNKNVSIIQNNVERIGIGTSGSVKINSLTGTGTGIVTADDDGELTIERPPASGTYTLKSIDGVIQWVED